jgi:hypothetical protein
LSKAIPDHRRKSAVWIVGYAVAVYHPKIVPVISPPTLEIP